ncbi:unnamed protein product [Schistocephalus solidus]|uniref:Uncharacterized protein n=1 Tax=Schistocephalus solidus TaxID=70667 RepID=A0A183TRL4_SCHSO|nr:unnamed protein product [Schistocephalus solidus]
MLSAMVMDAYDDEQPGIRISYRTDGHLLNSRRMQAQTRVSTATTSMDLYATGCANFELTVVMQQPPPSVEYNTLRINVNGARIKYEENFAYLGNTAFRKPRIEDDVS